MKQQRRRAKPDQPPPLDDIPKDGQVCRKDRCPYTYLHAPHEVRGRGPQYNIDKKRKKKP